MADMQKFKDLVHYVCAQSPSRAKLGATKLNKILWYAERDAYVQLGHPISGAKFVKRQFGPVPKAIMPVLGVLQSDRAIAIRETIVFGKSKREFISLVTPNISGFKPEEISIVNSAIYTICNFHTADSISKKSHDDVWELAEIGEEIPLLSKKA
jgi:hypothetical protein